MRIPIYSIPTKIASGLKSSIYLSETPTFKTSLTDINYLPGMAWNLKTKTLKMYIFISKARSFDVFSISFTSSWKQITNTSANCTPMANSNGNEIIRGARILVDPFVFITRLTTSKAAFVSHVERVAMHMKSLWGMTSAHGIGNVNPYLLPTKR